MLYIRPLRESRGLSQRALARRAGVSFRTLQLLEVGDRDARWSTVLKVAAALGRDATALERSLERFFLGAGDTASGAAARLAEAGEKAWELPLFEFVDAFRRQPGPRRVAEAPPSDLSPRLAALLASTVEALCFESALVPPWWCVGVPPLREPWFVSGIESLKASALLESPVFFRRRNIFVLANFLARA